MANCCVAKQSGKSNKNKNNNINTIKKKKNRNTHTHQFINIYRKWLDNREKNQATASSSQQQLPHSIILIPLLTTIKKPRGSTRAKKGRVKIQMIKKNNNITFIIIYHYCDSLSLLLCSVFIPALLKKTNRFFSRTFGFLFWFSYSSQCMKYRSVCECLVFTKVLLLLL